MRILTWNILHGGGSRRIPGIALEVLGHRPDVVVVTEARRAFGGQLAGALADAGLQHALDTAPPAGVNGVMLVSRYPLERVETDAPECLRHRWLEAWAPEAGLHVGAVHLAEAARRTEHAMGWKHVIARAGSRREGAFAIAGDLNTWRDGAGSRPRTGASARNLGRLAALGYADAWLKAGAGPGGRDGGETWTGHDGRSYRLDYVLVSSALAGRLEGASTPRISGETRLSDHLPVLADLGPAGQNACD